MKHVTRGVIRTAAIAAAAGLCTALTTASASAAEHERFHDGGRVRGVVTAVNYRRNEVTLKTRKGELHISVSATTPVASADGDGYHGISDIHVGSRLEVEVSAHGDGYDAQTIEIHTR